MSTDVSTNVLAPGVDYLPAPDPKAVEQAMLIGDLSQMTDEQRIAYYVAVCRSLGLNALTRPFMALQGDDGKLSLYPDKGCAEQLRKLHRVSLKVIGREFLDDLYIVTVRASTPDGREEESQGVVPIAKAKGTWEDYEYQGKKRRRFKPAVDRDGQEVMMPLSISERATAIMRCETKAKRRATLAICGLGLPDWEQEPGQSAHPMALTLQTSASAETEKGLADHSADLSDPLDATAFRTLPDTPAPDTDPGAWASGPAGEAGAEYIAQIERTILAQPGGNVEHWMVWAERHLKKSRQAFTVEDQRLLLEAVERGVEKASATARPQGRDWETLRIHQADERLPPALLDRIAAVVTSGTDAQAEELARTVLDILDNADDDPVNGGN